MRARRLLPCLVLLGGCNQLFGLDAPAADHDDGGDDDSDAATSDGTRPNDGDGGDTTDAADIGIDASLGLPGVIWAIDLDYVTSTGRARGLEASATFGVTESCSRLAVSGNCFTERCTSVLPQTPAPNSMKITIEGMALVELSPDTNGNYAPVSNAGTSFFDGDVTCGTYSEGGTAVPPFSSTAVSPPVVTLEGPALPSPTAPTSVARTVGFTIQWQPTTGTIYLLLSDNGGGRMHCNFPASAGAAQVPPAVLEDLLAGPGTLAAYSIVRTSFLAGSYDVQWNLAHVARRSDGALARGVVTLQ